MDINPPSDEQMEKNLSCCAGFPFMKYFGFVCLFVFLCAKAFQFHEGLLVNRMPYFLSKWSPIENFLSYTCVWVDTSYGFLQQPQVSRLGLSSIWSYRCRCHFILWPTDTQFSQDRLLKMLSHPAYVSGILSNVKWLKLCAHVCVFSFVPLAGASVFMPMALHVYYHGSVIQLKIWNDSPSIVGLFLGIVL